MPLTRRSSLALLATRTPPPQLGGRGCIVHKGRIVNALGDQAVRKGVVSSASAVLTTLLALRHPPARAEEPFGRDPDPKDRSLALARLTSITSGFARTEAPWTAWADNGRAISLYPKTPYGRVFRQASGEVQARVGHAPGLEDGFSVRDGASIRPDSARGARFSRSRSPKPGPGGSRCCAGVCGGNSWFSRTGRPHADSLAWPYASQDTFLPVGAGRNGAVTLPDRQLTIIAVGATRGRLLTNRHIQALVRS